jgi:hypothetical protein
MTIFIKVRNLQSVELGLNEDPQIVAFKFRPEKFDGYFMADDELVVIINGETYTAIHTDELQRKLDKLVGDG